MLYESQGLSLYPARDRSRRQGRQTCGGPGEHHSLPRHALARKPGICPQGAAGGAGWRRSARHHRHHRRQAEGGLG